MLTDQESAAERVVRVELELRAARPEGAALDLGDHTAVDALDDAAPELGADDREVAQLLARREFEQCEARARARAARRAVDLTVGEHRHVALGQRALVLPEDDAV